jgi:protoporphyrinogen oxidase
MNNDGKNAIIVGAGPAGLTAAIELLRKSGIHPIILEETDRIGGISATVCHNGNRMDLGGHRFFSKNDEILRWWTSFLPVQGKSSSDDSRLEHNLEFNECGPDPHREDRVMLLRRRISRIYYLRKFFDYPISLKPQTFINMGFLRTVKAGIGYIGAKIAPRNEKTLEDFMINRFGAPLYHMFFEDYTEKVWGVHPTRLSSDWGAQRIKGLSMTRVLLQALKSLTGGKSGWAQKNTETSLIEMFLYPKYGPGHFWETVADEIVRLGGKLHYNSKVTAVNLRNSMFESVEVEQKDGTKATYRGECLFSSMPVKDLIESIQGQTVPPAVFSVASSLPYRDFLTVGLLVKKITLWDKRTASGLIPDCWIYIQEPDVKIGRLQVFNNWSPYLVKDPKNTVWLGLEYFCNEGDDDWNMPDADFIQFAINELVKLGIIEPKDVLDTVRVRIKKAYPGYHGAYTAFDTVRQWLDTIENLYCIGRNGQHRYNNMDHSMLTAMEAVKALHNGTKEKAAIWSVNSEENYHETKNDIQK